MTMSAADFLDQWFETDVLKATMSASGIIGTFLGIRSPGTAYVLLHHYMGEIDGAFRSWGFSRGGTGGISLAIAAAAKEAGVEIRTQAPVEKILVKNGRAAGVALKFGEEISCNVVSSSVDPHLTFEIFLDSEGVAGGFPGQCAAVQIPRLVRESESGAERTAQFPGAYPESARICAARFRFRRPWNTWSAPTTMPNTGIFRSGHTSTW